MWENFQNNSRGYSKTASDMGKKIEFAQFYQTQGIYSIEWGQKRNASQSFKHLIRKRIKRNGSK